MKTTHFAAAITAALLISTTTPAHAEGNNSGQSQTLSSGGATTCFINNGTNTTYGQGRLYCWGRNDHGQIGDGSNIDRTTPVQTAGALRFYSVSVGSRHTCGVTTAGAMYCWGANQDRQLGIPLLAAGDFLTPQFVSAGAWYGVSAGDHSTCGIIYGPGEAWCWGLDIAGSHPAPYQITKPTGVGYFYSVSVGFNHACATFSNSAGTSYGVACWGTNTYGQVGDSSTTDRATPIIVSATSGGPTSYQACTFGVLPCSNGINTANEGGLWSFESITSPWGYGVSAGNLMTCAVPNPSYNTGGYAKQSSCWGFGKWSAGGNALGYKTGCAAGDYSCVFGAQNYSKTPLPVDITYTDNHAQASCNASQPLHYGPWPCFPDFNTGYAVDGINFTAGGQHTCGYVRPQGFTVAYLHCWGRNGGGQLGTGNTTDAITPVYLSSMPTLTSPTPNEAGLGLGEEHTCALQTTASNLVVRCWGRNNSGRLGTGGAQDGTAHSTPATTLSQPKA